MDRFHAFGLRVTISTFNYQSRIHTVKRVQETVDIMEQAAGQQTNIAIIIPSPVFIAGYTPDIFTRLSYQLIEIFTFGIE